MRIKVREFTATGADLREDELRRLLGDTPCSGPGRLVCVQDDKGRAFAWVFPAFLGAAPIPLEPGDAEAMPLAFEEYRTFGVRVSKDRLLMGVENAGLYDRIHRAHFKEVLLLILFRRGEDGLIRESWLSWQRKAAVMSVEDVDESELPGEGGTLPSVFLDGVINGIHRYL